VQATAPADEQERHPKVWAAPETKEGTPVLEPLLPLFLEIHQVFITLYYGLL
jgi:hypothetical protein